MDIVVESKEVSNETIHKYGTSEALQNKEVVVAKSIKDLPKTTRISSSLCDSFEFPFQ